MHMREHRGGIALGMGHEGLIGYGDKPLRLIERVGNSWYIKRNFAYNAHGKSRFCS